MMDRYDIAVHKAGQEQIKIFVHLATRRENPNPEAYIQTIVTSSATRFILNEVYLELIRRKALLPLEACQESLKREAWETAKKDAAGRLTAHDLRIFAKILYTLNHLLTLKQ